MAKRKFSNYLISKDEINEPIKLIDGSETDYVTPSGKIFSKYEKDKFYPKKNHINKHNGYTYCGIHFPDGNKQRRVHILVAQAFVPNPNGYTIVGHKNNIKSSTNVDNLYWTTVQENTKRAYEDGLAKNDKGFQDSQSKPVDVYSLDGKFIESIGSCRQAALKYNTRIQTITYHCQKKTTRSKTLKVTFRFQNEAF